MLPSEGLFRVMKPAPISKVVFACDKYCFADVRLNDC